MRSMLLVVSLAMGCAHGSKGPPEAEAVGKPNPQVLTRLKQLAPRGAGNGLVVLYRNTRFGGIFGPLSFNGSLWLDEQAVGDVQDDRYNVIELPAGRHSFRVLGTAPGIVVPLQATTVVSLGAGETKLLELNSVQEFSNVTLRFRPGAPLETIAVDCTEGFVLDLGPAEPKVPGTPAARL